MPSNKKFGYFFSLILFLLSIFFLNNENFFATTFSLLTLVFLLILTHFYPNMLTKPNRAWFNFGIILGKIVNPIILGILFFFLLSPLSIFLRLILRDRLGLKNNSKKSFWNYKDKKKFNGEFFKNQF